MNTRTILVLLVVSAVAVVGCPRENSCNILTDGIYCAFRVVEQDGQATVSATFTVGSLLGTELALGAECGDDITVNGVALQQRGGALVYYQAVLDVADSYEFVFTRGEEETYTSTVTAPPPVTITAPVDGTQISRAAAFDITWEDNYAESPGIALFIGGDCIQEVLRDIGDNGLYTINAEELEEVGEDTTCDVDLILSRVVDGTLDAGLKGFVRATSTDRIWFTSTP